eukprot:305602_1
MGTCVSAAEGTPNPPDSADDGKTNVVVQKSETEETNVVGTEENSNDKTLRSRNSNDRNPIRALTTRKDYTASINAMNEANASAGFKMNRENDKEIEYNDDGVTIKTKINGLTVNEYGNQRYDDKLVRDEVLDDILIT